MVGTSGSAVRRAVALVLGSAIALAACGGGGSGTPRPTDPRQILVQAIGATAALPTLRLHVEVAMNLAGFGGQAAGGLARIAMDADIDLATRQLAGRETTQLPAGLGAGAAQAQQIDVIVMQTAIFARNSQTGRWQKQSNGGFAGGPTNEQIATMLANLLSNPSVSFETAESSPCTLGTCDHVVAHVDGKSLAAAVGQLFGAPVDAQTSATIPNFDIDVLVDQATSVISELRTGYSMQGQSAQILVTLTNPGQPVQIGAPPAAITDDFGANFGGGGGVAPAPTIGPVESGILDEVGNELESAMPTDPEVLPSTP